MGMGWRSATRLLARPSRRSWRRGARVWRPAGLATDADVSLPRRRVPLEAIERRVVQRYGLAPEALRRDGRAVGEAKAVAVELACRLTGLTQRAVGGQFGGVTSSAVGKLRLRLRGERAQKPPTERVATIDALMAKIVYE